MPIHGLKSGLAIRGMQSGVLSGNALAGIESGYRSGMNNNLPEKQKMLNPLNLTGDKKPLIYGLADYSNISTGNTTNLNDIANTGNYWRSNSSTSNRPIPIANKLNGKYMLSYASSSSVMITTGASSFQSGNRSAYTIMAVIKLNGTSGNVVFDNNSIVAGAIQVSCPGGSVSPFRMASKFNSQSSVGSTYVTDVGPSTNFSNTPYEFTDYMIVTAKYRLTQPGGVGSEQDFFINGRRHHILSGVDNFSETSLKSWSLTDFSIGNIATITSPNTFAQGFEMGMGMILPYWLEYSEQVKIENYFRWYYNKSF